MGHSKKNPSQQRAFSGINSQHHSILELQKGPGRPLRTTPPSCASGTQGSGRLSGFSKISQTGEQEGKDKAADY